MMCLGYDPKKKNSSHPSTSKTVALELDDRNIHKILKSVKCKNRENIYIHQRKNNHTQDSIYVVWQFAYIHEVVGISLFLGKNTRCDSTIFSLKSNIKP